MRKANSRTPDPVGGQKIEQGGGVPQKVGAEGGECPRDAQQGNVTGETKACASQLGYVHAAATPDEQRL